MTRAERRRAVLAARKEAKRSSFAEYPAPGIAPLLGSAGARARELFIRAAETGESHPYAGMSVADIREVEHERRPVPNRAMARRYGIRSGYTRRLHARLAMAAEMKRMDELDANPARKAAYDAVRKIAAARASRRVARQQAA